MVVQVVHCIILVDDMHHMMEHALWRRIQKAPWRKWHLREPDERLLWSSRCPEEIVIVGEKDKPPRTW